MTQSQKEFEAWMIEHGSKLVMADTLKVNDEYAFPETKVLWLCWQASRKKSIELYDEVSGD